MVMRELHTRTPNKEVNTFWLRSAAQNPQEYFRMMRKFPLQLLNDTRVTMEASPYYFSIMADVWENLDILKSVVPNAKYVTIVRNPVDRAFSDFLMLSDAWNYSSICHNTTFEDIVREELVFRNHSLLTDKRLHHSCLVHSPKFMPIREPEISDYRGRLVRYGEYAHYLRYWLKAFNSSQHYILTTEDLKTRPNETLADLVLWLGLEPHPLRALEYNRAGCRRSRNGNCNEEGTNHLNTQRKYSRDMAHLLQKYFLRHNFEFAKLTGVVVDEWNTKFKELYVQNVLH